MKDVIHKGRTGRARAVTAVVVRHTAGDGELVPAQRIYDMSATGQC